MNDLAFAGYRSFEAAIEDQLRAKWNEMQTRIKSETLALIPPAPILWQANAFNLQINRLIAFNSGEAEALEAWQTPAETLAARSGDCKDYALLKYAVLTKANIPARVVIGEIKNILANQHHAWCAGYIDGCWRALDNKFDELVRVEEYLNWIPLAAMHGESVLRFGRQFTINEIARPTAP